MTNSFDPQWSPTSDSYVEDKVIAVWGRGKCIPKRGEDGGAGVETWNDGQHVLVCDGYIDCCYAYLAGCRWVGDWVGWVRWGRISRVVVDHWVCRDLDVNDCVMEGLHG